MAYFGVFSELGENGGGWEWMGDLQKIELDRGTGRRKHGVFKREEGVDQAEKAWCV